MPVIVDQGLTLSESSAIIEYLHECFPGIGEPLWPDAIDQRAAARRLSEEASAYLYPNVRRLVVEIVNRRDGEPDGIAKSSARQLWATNADEADTMARRDSAISNYA